MIKDFKVRRMCFSVSSPINKWLVKSSFDVAEVISVNEI